MAAGSYSIKGDWVRINIFLPVNDAVEIRAAGEVITCVRNHYSGATHTLVRPHIFDGYWFDENKTDPSKSGWVKDKICWVVADAPYPVGDTDLDDDIFLLELEVLHIYNTRYHKDEKEVWIIVHQAWKNP